MKQELDFETLNNEDPVFSYHTTFAYWLGVLRDPQSQFGRDPDEAWCMMSCQYDSEEQALSLADLRDTKGIIPDCFEPVAPVTLARRWSPFPDAIVALGEPLAVRRGEARRVAVIFQPVPMANEPPHGTDDLSHFRFLLFHANARAFKNGRFVFLVGSPGWSYDAEDGTDCRSIRKLMQRAGYVHTTRKP